MTTAISSNNPTQQVVYAFPPDLAKAITAEFAAANTAISQAQTVRGVVSAYAVGNLYSPQPDGMGARRAAFVAAYKLTPAWYAKGGGYNNLSQGADGNTGYVSYRVLSRNGVPIWNVPESYKLNEGNQIITDEMARASGGFRVLPSTTVPGTMGAVGNFWNGGFVFFSDPRPILGQFVGLVGRGYTPGISGRQITREAATGIAIVIAAPIAGYLAFPVLLGTVGPAGLTGGVLTTEAATAGSAAGGIAGGADGISVMPSSAGINVGADIPAFTNSAAVSTAAETSADLYTVADGAYAAVGGAPVVAGSAPSVGLFGNIATVLEGAGKDLLAGVKALAVSTAVTKGAQAVGLTPKKTAMTNAPREVPPPQIYIGGAQSSESFISTTKGQLTIAVVSGLIVILLAKVFL